MTSPGSVPHINASARITDSYNIFLDAANCASLACLRSASEKTIANASAHLLLEEPSVFYGPIIDGGLVPDLPDTLLKEGLYHKSVERVIASSMANDGDLGLDGRYFPSHDSTEINGYSAIH
jgi:carboxylesterase type B